MAHLTTQEQILIQLKKQNALLEEQLRPQREEERRRELWRQEQEENYKLERELNHSRRVIAERHLKILSAYRLRESLSNQRCPIVMSCQPRWNMEEHAANQAEEARKWHEEFATKKLKVEEELKQLHESEAKQLAKLRKYYKPHIYADYIERFIKKIRQQSHWDLEDALKSPYMFRVRL